jgi:hypothetical protein
MWPGGGGNRAKCNFVYHLDARCEGVVTAGKGEGRMIR